MVYTDTAYARAGLVGNPSDIFQGKVISLLFDAFSASVTLYESPKLTISPNSRDLLTFDSMQHLASYRRQLGYYGGVRLIEALIVRFFDYCRTHDIELAKKNFTVEYESTIPFGIGLGGSSAIIKATLAALMRFFGLTDADIPRAVQPNIVLESETEELDISAGPQDRVIVVYGGVVYMDFSRQAYACNEGLHGHYERLDPKLLPPLFVAYDEGLAKSSGKVHNIMRYRASVEHDERVLEVMERKAALACEARRLLLDGGKEALGPIMSRDFDLRESIYDITPRNLRLIEITRGAGAHAKLAGSGGAVIGTYRGDGQYAELRGAYERHGLALKKVRVVGYEQ